MMVQPPWYDDRSHPCLLSTLSSPKLPSIDPSTEALGNSFLFLHASLPHPAHQLNCHLLQEAFHDYFPPSGHGAVATHLLHWLDGQLHVGTDGCHRPE